MLPVIVSYAILISTVLYLRNKNEPLVVCKHSGVGKTTQRKYGPCCTGKQSNEWSETQKRTSTQMTAITKYVVSVNRLISLIK